MCQIIWDSQFVHNAHILALWMQHYSKTVSFQEIQCSGEVNIYLHNLTLLSDCLIFPSDFPLLFHSTPKLSFKTSSTKKTWLPQRIQVSVILMMQCVLSIIPGSSLDMFCILAHSFCCSVASLTNPPATPAKATSTPSSHLISSYRDSFPILPHSTPTLFFYCYYCYYHSLHQHSPLQLLLREALSCLPLCYLKTACPPAAPFEHKDQCHLWNNECK